MKEKRAVIGEKGTDQKGKGPLIRKRKERGTYQNKIQHLSVEQGTCYKEKIEIRSEKGQLNIRFEKGKLL